MCVSFDAEPLVTMFFTWYPRWYTPHCAKYPRIFVPPEGGFVGVGVGVTDGGVVGVGVAVGPGPVVGVGVAVGCGPDSVLPQISTSVRLLNVPMLDWCPT